jgi:ribosomal protein L11 methyltransferase
VLASDIDPIATTTTIENARDNGVGPLVRAVTAPGLDHIAIARGAPYDLIVANILAGPLAALAPGIARAAAPGATIILSGLLATQSAWVANAYRAQNIVLRQRLIRGEWATLILERPARPSRR